MEVDIRSTYSIVSEHTFDSLKLKKEIMPINIIFRTYDKRILPDVAFLQVTIAYQQKEFSAGVYIVDANLDSICGREWVFQAGINLVNVNEIEAKDRESSNRTNN
ncbi:hypothetical protein QE152_g5645 [Popillia japonica]|uniref:Uncharacterized protein n=1 Tax=Popillia japonica TaxID=7064 RepID=A0AAW1MLU5_POPJA